MKLEAPAKINLTLEVTAVESNGYHTLDTLFVWLDLHDSLECEAAEVTSLEMTSDGADLSRVESDESNLVLRALRSVEAKVGRTLPTAFRLTKRIPAGGGLGGGSADAAAALIGLRRLHGLDLSDEELHSLAARLGADVAFGLMGGFARGTRYGDVLERLSLPEDLHDRTLVLLAPGFACPTPEVYRAWDVDPKRPAEGSTERFLSAAADRRLGYIQNDLEPAAVGLYPQLGTLKSRMQSLGLEAVTLSGSGSTLFGFIPRAGLAEEPEIALAEFGRVTRTTLRKGERYDA